MVDPPRPGCAVLRHYTASYLEWGEGPPLVLVPGLAGGTGLMRPLAGQLARHFRVICYELRGEEDSFALRRRFGMANLVADLAELLDHLGLESPLIMGISFGGALAVNFAARHRPRLSGLAVQGVDVRLAASLFRQVAGKVLEGYPLPHDNPFVNQFFHLFFGGKPRNRALVEAVARQCWQTDQAVMAHRFRLIEHLDLAPLLPRIQAPTLLIRAERDLCVSDAGWLEMRTGLPHVRSTVLPGAGHLASVTHPEILAGRMAEFANLLSCV